MIERRIIIGLITSTEFIQEIRPMWENKLLESAVARRLAMWCIEYFDKYNTAPGREIETIYYSKLKSDKIPPDLAEEIEEDILPDLSDEYEAGVNYKYLLQEAKKHLKERSLVLHKETIDELIKEGEVEEAERVALDYKNRIKETGTDVDMSHESILIKVEHAFTNVAQPVVMFPGALGDMWNEHFTRGGLVALMAPEKRGKTFWLLDIAFRGSRQKAKVAFFQAGDMTEDQQLIRMCIYRAKKSNKEKYCGEIYIPTKDCIFNQTDNCDRGERESPFGIFSVTEANQFEQNLRKSIDRDILKEKLEENPDYVPCYNCKEYLTRPWGTPWLMKKNVGNPLEAEQAKREITDFFIRKKRAFKLSTYANGTLTVDEIRAQLSIWEKTSGFTPDLIVVDYADLLVNSNKEFRHGQDMIWKGLRAMSQERHCLVVTATQADAKSYDQDRLKLSNFSEDKRKYAHVTAMYGLNQDPGGREKALGIMRINELVVREGEFNNAREVTVLNSLYQGQPFLTSYW